MRYLFGFMCVCAIGLVPLIGCGETTGVDWQSAAVRLEDTDLHFGKGSLRVEAGREPVRLVLPVARLDPAEEVALPSTGYLGVLAQFSVHVRGGGRGMLRLVNVKQEGEVAEKEVAFTREWQRPCLALDGTFAARELQIEILVQEGYAEIDGLLLEPYVVTYRSIDRALLVPCPGPWVPGGGVRAADRLVLPLKENSLPASGVVDFWFRPLWQDLHVQHAFFQACHGYFGFELADSHPVLFAGEKPCPWMYYWEWGQAEGFAANTWHHGALVWREQGGATIYFDGQARAHVEQVPAHAFDPGRAGRALAIGTTLDNTMSLDPNVPAELDAYLASWRLHSGAPDAASVLVMMEEARPLLAHRQAPERAFFFQPGKRERIAEARDHCWFVHNLGGNSARLLTCVARGDDHHPGPNLRLSTSDKPRSMESVDGGSTWQASEDPPVHEQGILADGSRLDFSWLVDGDPPTLAMTHIFPDGRQEAFQAVLDTSSLANWIPHTRLCAHRVLRLREGRYLLFASGSYPGVKGSAVAGSSVFVFESDDARQWRALAAPYRPDGIHDRFNETSAVELPGGRIVILMRTGGWNMKLAKGISDDGGRTWSPPLASGLRGIQPRMRLLKDGTIIVATGRPGIILAASCDGGETFSPIACAEDDRIHEFSNMFGWYGYSCMNNGLVVDEAEGMAYLSYDLLDTRHEADGTLLNACHLRPYRFTTIPNYAGCVNVLSWGAEGLSFGGSWQQVNDSLAVTNETGASVCGSFTGTTLVGLFETSTHAGVVEVTVDGGEPVILPLYLPYRLVQRQLLAHELAPGTHTFAIRLITGLDPEHKFANPEMPMLGGMQTVHMSGVSTERRLAVYGLEFL